MKTAHVLRAGILGVVALGALAIGVVFFSMGRPLGSPIVPTVLRHPPLWGYGQRPLSFEVNQGQTDARVKFLSRGRGYTLFLTPTEAVLILARPAGVADVAAGGIHPHQVGRPGKLNAPAALPTPSGQLSGGARRAEPAVLRMRLAGTNTKARVEGLEELPGKSNYFLGNDPKKWRTKVAHYGKVRYREVYPGVDLVYYGNQRQLEHDFVVAPGVDPGAIRLAFEGGSDAQQPAALEIDRRGDLVVHLADAEMRLQRPVVYQELGGVRQEISGGYVLKGGHEVGFQLGAYDPSKALVIDPVFVYSTYLGGANNDSGHGIAVDSEGNAYITGLTVSRDFPTANALQPAYDGGASDAFVAKLNADGSALVYSTYMGGSQGDEGFGIAVDARGNAYVAGHTFSMDFPTVNALQLRYGGSGDAFVAKLNADGSALVYSTYLGGSENDIGQGIAVDAQSNAYVTGSTSSRDFPTANALQPEYAGGTGDAFVAKLSADGSTLVYSTYLGGTGSEGAHGIALDGEGNTCLIGSTNSTDFPVVNPLQPEYGGGKSDAFVAKLDTSGSTLVYSTYLGGRGSENGWAIAVDADGNAYLTGGTSSPNFPTVNPWQPELRGSDDAFVAKLDPEGSALSYSTYLGGRGGDAGLAVAVDREGNAYVAGQTSSRDFPTVDALQPDYGGGPFDAFLTKLNADGSALVYSTYLGGNSLDAAGGMAVDPQGNAYVAGFTHSNDFPTANPLQPDLAGLGDAFIVKLRPLELGCQAKPRAAAKKRSKLRHNQKRKERR